MIQCTGAPAEQLAEQYIAGTLPDQEAQAFEEHYFDCPVCLAQLQALQAVAKQMPRNPVRIPGRVIQWPAVIAAFGSIAALLLIAVIGYRNLEHRSDVAKNPGQGSSAGQKTEPPSSSSPAAAQLADLTLPPFQGSSLRGAAEDANYAAGMKAYENGDCSRAAGDLARVLPKSADALSAQFYSGVCQMKLNQLDAASAILDRVASKGDSPQQEAALYYLAQIALLQGDSTGARQNLEKVISLRGEFEQRAETQLSKLPADPKRN